MGFVASARWFWVCLGSKFWQARWEQRLLEFEREHMPSIAFFGASPSRIREDVEKGLTFHEVPRMQRLIYRLALRKKPSVSYSMVRLSVLFVIGWVGLIGVSILKVICATS
jgi:hypothetical protein